MDEFLTNNGGFVHECSIMDLLKTTYYPLNYSSPSGVCLLAANVDEWLTNNGGCVHECSDMNDIIARGYCGR